MDGKSGSFSQSSWTSHRQDLAKLIKNAGQPAWKSQLALEHKQLVKRSDLVALQARIYHRQALTLGGALGKLLAWTQLSGRSRHREQGEVCPHDGLGYRNVGFGPSWSTPTWRCERKPLTTSLKPSQGPGFPCFPSQRWRSLTMARAPPLTMPSFAGPTSQRAIHHRFFRPPKVKHWSDVIVITMGTRPTVTGHRATAQEA